MEGTTFFNLPEATLNNGRVEKASFEASDRQYNVSTNWKTTEIQSMNRNSIIDCFAGAIPAIRQKDFLSSKDCAKMVEVLESHKIGIYKTEHVWPRVGCVGVAQTDHVHDKEGYFSAVKDAYSLQNRWKKELGIDVLGRIAESLRLASGMLVRKAREGEREYFAGVIRAIDTGIQIHADYAPFEGNGWEIGCITAQMSWNILLNPVPGGETVIYDRSWNAPHDDINWRKEFPKYAYDPRIVDGCAVKVMKPAPGDLYWFNPRYFHEVRSCDISRDSSDQRPPTRYTISSFIGYLPAQGSEPEAIVLWS